MLRITEHMYEAGEGALQCAGQTLHRQDLSRDMQGLQEMFDYMRSFIKIVRFSVKGMVLMGIDGHIYCANFCIRSSERRGVFDSSKYGLCNAV